MEKVYKFDYSLKNILDINIFLKNKYSKYKSDVKNNKLIKFLSKVLNCKEDEIKILLCKYYDIEYEIFNEEKILLVLQNEFCKKEKVNNMYFDYNFKLSKKEDKIIDPKKIIKNFLTCDHIEEIIISKEICYLIIFNKDVLTIFNQNFEKLYSKIEIKNLISKSDHIKNVSLKKNFKLKNDIFENLKKNLNKKRVIIKKKNNNNNNKLIINNINNKEKIINKSYRDNYNNMDLNNIKNKKDKNLKFIKSSERKIINNIFNQIFKSNSSSKKKINNFSDIDDTKKNFSENYKNMNKQINHINKTISLDKKGYLYSNKDLKNNDEYDSIKSDRKNINEIKKISKFNNIFNNNKLNEIYFDFFDFYKSNLFILLKSGIILLFNIHYILIKFTFKELIKIKNFPYIINVSKKIYDYRLMIIGYKTGELIIYNINNINEEEKEFFNKSLNNNIMHDNISDINKIEIIKDYIYILYNKSNIKIMKILKKSIINYYEIKKNDYKFNNFIVLKNEKILIVLTSNYYLNYYAIEEKNNIIKNKFDLTKYGKIIDLRYFSKLNKIIFLSIYKKLIVFNITLIKIENEFEINNLNSTDKNIKIYFPNSFYYKIIINKFNLKSPLLYIFKKYPLNIFIINNNIYFLKLFLNYENEYKNIINYAKFIQDDNIDKKLNKNKIINEFLILNGNHNFNKLLIIKNFLFIINSKKLLLRIDLNNWEEPKFTLLEIYGNYFSIKKTIKNTIFAYCDKGNIIEVDINSLIILNKILLNNINFFKIKPIFNSNTLIIIQTKNNSSVLYFLNNAISNNIFKIDNLTNTNIIRKNYKIPILNYKRYNDYIIIIWNNLEILLTKGKNIINLKIVNINKDIININNVENKIEKNKIIIIDNVFFIIINNFMYKFIFNNKYGEMNQQPMKSNFYGNFNNIKKLEKINSSEKFDYYFVFEKNSYLNLFQEINLDLNSNSNNNNLNTEINIKQKKFNFNIKSNLAKIKNNNSKINRLKKMMKPSLYFEDEIKYTKNYKDFILKKNLYLNFDNIICIKIYESIIFVLEKNNILTLYKIPNLKIIKQIILDNILKEYFKILDNNIFKSFNKLI